MTTINRVPKDDYHHGVVALLRRASVPAFQTLPVYRMGFLHDESGSETAGLLHLGQRTGGVPKPHTTTEDFLWSYVEISGFEPES